MKDFGLKMEKALSSVFTSPNVSDSNMEPANVVDALDNIARALHRIANEMEKENNKGGYDATDIR
jgi:hypothetical protein